MPTYRKTTPVSQVIGDLEATRSKLEKIEILEAAKAANVNFLTDVLEATYNPFKQYGIQAVPEFDTINEATSISAGWKRFLKFASALEKKEITGNKAKERLLKEINQMPLAEREIAKRVIKKDMRCGATESTYNKVWPALIPTFKVSLCDRPDEKTIKRIKFPCFADEKVDALRCCVVYKDGVVRALSRSGKEMKLFGALDADIKKTCNANMMVDGELVFLNEARDAILPRKTSNGIANKAIRGTISEEEASRAVLKVWDAVPFADFTSGECNIDYEVRAVWLKRRLKEKAVSKLKFVDQRIVNSLYEARAFFVEVVEMGGEGIILKNFDSKWTGKRAKDNLKFKLVRESDLIVLGIEAGAKGKKHEHHLGGLICGSKDGKIVVTVGGGYSDAQRDEFWTADMIGKIVAVEFNEVIDKDNDSGIESLFLPVFVEVRNDKFEADDYETICNEKGMKIWELLLGK